MKIAGMLPSSAHTLVAMVEGAKDAPARVALHSSKLKTPKDEQEGAVLSSFLALVSTWLDEHAPDRIVVLAAGNKPHGGKSSLRTKLEAIIQLACHQKQIPCDLLAPQTLRAREKKFVGEVGGTVEQQLNEGKDFKPKQLRDAALTAWVGLDGERA